MTTNNFAAVDRDALRADLNDRRLTPQEADAAMDIYAEGRDWLNPHESAVRACVEITHRKRQAEALSAD